MTLLDRTDRPALQTDFKFIKNCAARVLMLVENRFPADPRVRNEANCLVQAGYRVTVIALRAPEERVTEVVDGVRVYRLPRLTLFHKTSMTGSSFLRRCQQQVKATVGYLAEYAYFSTACLLMSCFVAIVHGFDVVHAHNPPDTLFIVGAFHKIFGKKLVFDQHDLSPELFMSRFGAQEGLITRALGVFELLSYKLSDLTIATNESYKEIAMNRGRLSERRLMVVRNGPDLNRIRRVEPDESLRKKAKTILLYLGTMNPQDGLNYLLAALRVLAFQLGRKDFFCVLIGAGDCLEELKAMAIDTGLENFVKFTGFVPDEDLCRYLSTADICLDPNPSSPLSDVSTWIKVMEYMAVGKPTISFDLKETRFTAREAAVYVPPNDVSAFASTISMLMDDPGLRAEMGEYGKTRIETELNWAITSRSLLNAYSGLCADHTSATSS
jgi:glycosyltransferase involved in cell wall biosynthesis